MSGTTSCSPSVDPGAAELMPLPMMIEHSEPGGSLHLLQVIDGADGHRDAEHLRLAGPGSKLLVAGNSVQALDDVEPAEIGLDRDLLATGQRRGDRDRAPQERISPLHVPARGNRDLGNPFEILRMGGNDDVDVLGAAHDAPCVERQSAHDDELGLCLRKAPQQFVEGRFAQPRRAIPVNRISL